MNRKFKQKRKEIKRSNSILKHNSHIKSIVIILCSNILLIDILNMKNIMNISLNSISDILVIAFF